MSDAPPLILFACTHNAGRSQMAAAFCNRLAGGHARGESAGTAPGAAVHEVVATAMREKGIDLSGAGPRQLTADLAAGARVLVTMGCGETCPVVPGVPRLDWPLDDPKGLPLERVRAIRDDIERRVRALLDDLGVPVDAKPGSAALSPQPPAPSPRS